MGWYTLKDNLVEVILPVSEMREKIRTENVIWKFVSQAS
jgi:hypothetical protein